LTIHPADFRSLVSGDLGRIATDLEIDSSLDTFISMTSSIEKSRP